MKKKIEYKEKAIYTGRRMNFLTNKVSQRFELLPDHTEMYFSGVKGVYVGYTYKCSKGSISAKPELTDDPRISNPTWQAEEAVVVQKLSEARERAKAENKIKNISKSEINSAVEAIVPLIKDLELPSDRSALIRHLIKIADGKTGKGPRR